MHGAVHGTGKRSGTLMITRYPIFLIHGLNCRDDRPFEYFGRIPSYLEGQGVRVYLGGQDAAGSIEGNARQLEKRLEEILRREGGGKVNIIAHSKGGLEARYLISTLGMASCVASLTTLCTPHQGSRTAKYWCSKKKLMRFYACAANRFWRLLGDEAPDSERALRQLTPAYVKSFNQKNPDSPLVYYQSFGARLTPSGEDLLMLLFRRLVFLQDGENDGLVAPERAHWGVYRGTVENISHQDLVDSRKRDAKGFCMTRFYGRLIQDLAKRGF